MWGNSVEGTTSVHSRQCLSHLSLVTEEIRLLFDERMKQNLRFTLGKFSDGFPMLSRLLLHEVGTAHLNYWKIVLDGSFGCCLKITKNNKCLLLLFFLSGEWNLVTKCYTIFWLGIPLDFYLKQNIRVLSDTIHGATVLKWLNLSSSKKVQGHTFCMQDDDHSVSGPPSVIFLSTGETINAKT